MSDLKNVSFSMAFRGYAPAEVNSYVKDVCARLEELESLTETYKRRVALLEKELEEAKASNAIEEPVIREAASDEVEVLEAFDLSEDEPVENLQEEEAEGETEAAEAETTAEESAEEDTAVEEVSEEYTEATVEETVDDLTETSSETEGEINERKHYEEIVEQNTKIDMLQKRVEEMEEVIYSKDEIISRLQEELAAFKYNPDMVASLMVNAQRVSDILIQEANDKAEEIVAEAHKEAARIEGENAVRQKELDAVYEKTRSDMESYKAQSISLLKKQYETIKSL